MPAPYDSAKRTPSERTILQDVPGAAHRLDELRRDVAQLLPQVAHVHLDDIGITFEVIAPHPFQDHLLAEHLAGVEHEQLEQVVLARRELHYALRTVDLMRVLIQA